MAYRKAGSAEAQALIQGNLSVRWDLLADAAQGPLVWKAMAHQMGSQALRMNLNTPVRHEVFSSGNAGWPAHSVSGEVHLAERDAYDGGGTDCSLPLVQANGKYAKRQFAGVVLVSDNESWVYAGRAFGYGQQGATGVMQEWQKFVAK